VVSGPGSGFWVYLVVAEMKVLVACEFSGIVREAFNQRGHRATSADILPSEQPGDHYQGDVREILDQEWDLMIAHPPCTWLCAAMRTNAARKDRHKISSIFLEERQKAFEFFMKLYNAPIERICIENPIGYMNGAFRKPDQIVHPYHFGHDIRKDTCLWLKGLPKLHWTKFIDPPYRKIDYWSNKRNPGGKSLKSITYHGIADAMADQWGAA